ncbi:hypothetical protein CIB93_33390 [Streptomyces sp. WZ.A104]|uniref:hypothetical protein n=1 Tax=Streptomyces sp. WZ.A104 TaxID=2023771 RepID=UPI000BBCF06E|nr:hypothetical protein [Streptomyces sp. WZ.A104]PCG81809.1 hypothetical protein CIB93_33390 [Streptomyces sp. WZ.A104]
MGTGVGKGARTVAQRRSIALHEAPAVAAFLGLVPLSVFAATAVWALDGDRERRFLLLMVCLGAAVAGVLALAAYRMLRGTQKTADAVSAVLYEDPDRIGSPPALPDSVPGQAGWRLLTWAYGTAFAGGLVGFWFLGVGEPGKDGRLHSTGELWAWGGSLAVIALYCALNVEGSVPRALPGHTRAVRGTVRGGQVVAAAGDDPRGPLPVDLRFRGTDTNGLTAAMEGRSLWLCWGTRRVKQDFTQDGPSRLDCAALLVFDGGQAVRARALFPPGRSPWAEGATTGSPEAPVDPAREVAAWNPRSLWPLTLPGGGFGLYALAGLCAGGLFTEGAPRGLLAVVGAIALATARGQHFPLMYERALAPAWYRDRSPARPETAAYALPLPAEPGTVRDAARPVPHATPGAVQAPPPSVEHTEPGTERVRRALRRAPVLTALAMLAPLSAIVALGVWLTWPGREARLALTAGCLAVAAGVLIVLLIHRIATGPIHPHEIEEARGAANGVQDTARRLRLRKARYLFGTIAIGGWLSALVFLIPAGDVTSSPLLDRLRAEGAVVADVTIERVSHVEDHYMTLKNGRRVRASVTEDLTVRLPTDSGSFGFATIRTESGNEHVAGHRIKVVYAPGRTSLGAYIGGDSRTFGEAGLGNWQHYQDDLQRLLDDRALSARQIGWLGALWLLGTGACVFAAYTGRADKPGAVPTWPLTITYTSFMTAGLSLAGSAVLLTDHVLGFGRLGLGAVTALCAMASVTMHRAPDEEGPARALEKKPTQQKGA